MKHLIFVGLGISLCSLSSITHATVLNSTLTDTGFVMIYYDWLSAFTQSSNPFTSPIGGAEEGSLALEVTGAYYNYTQCDYTGSNYDYVCETFATPLDTSRLFAKITMPYRVAVRPSKKKDAIDMSMSLDLQMALSFTDGATTVTIPDAHIAGKMIIKNNNRNIHFRLSAFDVSLTGTVMNVDDQAEMEAIITLIKSRLLNTWYYSRMDVHSYEEVMRLMAMSKQTMPIDIDMIVKSGILNNLGWDNQLGKYRITLNINRLPGIFDSLLMNNNDMMHDDAALESYDVQSSELKTGYDDVSGGVTLTGSLGRSPDGNIALTIDNAMIPFDEEDVAIHVSDCSISSSWTSCKVTASNGSGDAFVGQLSGGDTVSGASMSLIGSVSSQELIGNIALSSQKKATTIIDTDFTLPHRSRSWDKMIQSLDNIF